ncbi:unnamed protein product [Cylicocyclus nassatus]|uniref:Uncharacterized protein n=1 Tax=Cylicocyclus nassatus TaxID=53992 RepID=A0AA36DKU1_CYLNA|nr:unnamed protein product [Cylicocyclus nassatus]
MVVCWVTRMLFLMDWMEVRNVATRPAGAAVRPNKSVSNIIFRYAYPNQAAMYLPNGQAIVSQIFRDKATHNATYVDMEKLSKAMSFFLEVSH